MKYRIEPQEDGIHFRVLNEAGEECQRSRGPKACEQWIAGREYDAKKIRAIEIVREEVAARKGTVTKVDFAVINDRLTAELGNATGWFGGDYWCLAQYQGGVMGNPLDASTWVGKISRDQSEGLIRGLRRAAEKAARDN